MPPHPPTEPSAEWRDLPGVIRVHHVGIIVRDAEAAAETYTRLLGLEPVALEEFHGTLRVAFVRAGDALLELIQPVRDDTPWAAILRDRGEGAHHVALEVLDLRTAIASLRAGGIGVLDQAPSRAPGNTMSVFLDPATTGGTMIELVQSIQV
jgi:methylmalonyl-CoA epimerase